MAFLVLTIIAMGFYMTHYENYALYHIHKSLAVLAALFIIFRLVWRSYHPWQSASLGKKEEAFVYMVHRSLLLCLVLMPVTGLANSALGGFGLDLFEFSIVPKNIDSNGKIVAFNPMLSQLGRDFHSYLAYCFSALVMLHIGGALKNHFVSKNSTLIRMIKN